MSRNLPRLVYVIVIVEGCGEDDFESRSHFPIDRTDARYYNGES